MRLELHGRTFVIGTRNTTGGKPPTYLLEILPNGQRKYISSLYPLGAVGCYRMEFNGTWYHLDVSTPQTPVLSYYDPFRECAVSITIGT